MNSRFTVTEKVIAFTLIIWGTLSLYGSIVGLYYTFDMVFGNGRLAWQQISLFKILKNYHLTFFLPLTTIFAGFLLWFNKKIGWTTALIVTLLNAFLFLIPANKDEATFNTQENVFLIATISFCLLWAALFFILLLKPFRLKYSATSKTLWLVTTFVGLIMLDRAILYLTS